MVWIRRFSSIAMKAFCLLSKRRELGGRDWVRAVWSFGVIAAVARATEGSRGSQHQTPGGSRHRTLALHRSQHAAR
jgi:hypothetical protein